MADRAVDLADAAVPVSAADPGATGPDRPAPPRLVDLPAPAPTHRWRVFDRLVVVVFCVALLIPGLLLLAGRRSALIENRPLLSAPALSLGGLLDPAWYTAIDRFLTDNDALRPIAVRLRGETYWHLGGTGNTDVVKGQGDWLFTLEEIDPSCPLSADDIGAALDRTRAAFAAAGQQFRFVLAPDKHAIYPDRLDPGMPYGPACTDTQRTAMRAALAARPAFTVDGWAALLAARAAGSGGPGLFYTEDSHWTPTGAIAAIRPLIESFGPGLWNDADVTPGRPKRRQMELAGQLGLSRGETVPGVTVRPSVRITRKPLDLPVRTSGAQAVYEITATGDRPLVPGRTVVVYDSFFGLNMAAIAPFFADSIWIHEGDLLAHPEIASMIGPADRVIMERVERGLYFTRIDDVLRPLVRSSS